MVRSPACSLLFIWSTVFFHLFFVWRRVVSQPNISRADIPGIILPLYDVLYIRHVFIECGCRCCCSLCCYTSAVAAASAAVRHRVPDGKIVAGSLNLIPSSVSFLFIQTPFIFNVCTPWQHCRICGLDLPIRHSR